MGKGILITGARGFVGRNLTAVLEARGHTVLPFDQDSTPEQLGEACGACGFVFHLGAVSRPKDPAEYKTNNNGLTDLLLDTLEERGNRCPVMFSSSVFASLLGRYEGSPYGISKLESEQRLLAYSARTGAKVLIYRFPNLFGRWARPNYSSVVATFCHNIARGIPIQINGRDTPMELLYIDDLMEELLLGLEGRERRCEFSGVRPVPDPAGRYCLTPTPTATTLGELADLLEGFRDALAAGETPAPQPGSFAQKLLETYLSYRP